ncbi:hypothetical protein J7E88_09080 [Streptomyces sp. ISL-10]|uniref:hypothetical protein n=1 Tax=Streptomyces sp. ISL-10 TaxID=2819172 RepID=UPI001BEC3F8D|nr:hypothetical protein [Streptomyces sp. ISL-10]MBT2365468.1 hypothetical protein [Streptomyces sp. ISL-10]
MNDTEHGGPAVEADAREAGEHPQAGPRTRRPRRALWALLAVPLAVCGAVVAWWVWAIGSFMVSDDPFGTHSEVSCSTAMEFAHGTLPEKTTDEDCTIDQWMDDVVRGTFRMPRADVDEWLKAAYPDARPKEHCADDVCIEFGESDDPAEPFTEPTPSATAPTASATGAETVTGETPTATATATAAEAATGADVVRLTVRYENGTTALVTLEAFDV